MGKIKVLLIEDEITLAKIIKDTLESIGFDVCLNDAENIRTGCGTENTKNRPDYTCNLSDGKNRGGRCGGRI